MKTGRVLLWTGAFAAAVFCVVVAAKKYEAQVAERIVRGAPVEQPTSYNVTVSYAPGTGHWTCNDEEWEGEPMTTWGDWATTDRAVGWTVAFDITFLSSSTYSSGVGFADAITESVTLGGYAGVWISFEWLGTEDVLGVTYNKFHYGIITGLPDSVEDDLYVLPDDEMHTLSCTMTLAADLATRRGASPISPKEGVTHDKERVAADGWFYDSEQAMTATIGDLEWAGSPETAINPATAAVAFETGIQMHTQIDDILRLENIAFNGAPIDAGLLDEEVEPASTGGSWTGEKLWLAGNGNAIRAYIKAAIGSAQFNFTPTVIAPIVFIFGGLNVVDMEGN